MSCHVIYSHLIILNFISSHLISSPLLSKKSCLNWESHLALIDSVPLSHLSHHLHFLPLLLHLLLERIHPRPPHFHRSHLFSNPLLLLSLLLSLSLFRKLSISPSSTHLIHVSAAEVHRYFAPTSREAHRCWIQTEYLIRMMIIMIETAGSSRINNNNNSDDDNNSHDDNSSGNSDDNEDDQK